jgi:KaiC/GvpD/RAD55 family RecA-like ATPase
MDRIPLGVSRLDDIFGGGAPRGSVVLLVGEPGAGAREFLYTSAVMNGLVGADDDLFDLHYGDLHERAAGPLDVHYLTFTSDEESLRREMEYTIDEKIVSAAIDSIRFRDFSPEYFQLSPIPKEWYMGETTHLSDLGSQGRHGDVLNALGEYLSAHAADSIVLIDSITDLVTAISDDTAWSDVAMVMRGLSRASHQWGGLILLLVSRDTLEPTELGHLVDAADGTLQFEWESGGSMRDRTMVVQEFRGVLSRLEDENIVQFETEIHEGGFDVTDVRKIR